MMRLVLAIALTFPANVLAASSDSACDATCVAAIILIPIMVIFIVCCAVLSCTGYMDNMGVDGQKTAGGGGGGDLEAGSSAAVTGVVAGGEEAGVVDKEEEAPVERTADEEYKYCFELFSKGSDMLDTRAVADALNEIGAPHNEDVDLEDENWNSEISFDEFAADDVPMEDRPVNHAAVTALIAHMDAKSAA